jgi:hypothetical protein
VELNCSRLLGDVSNNRQLDNKRHVSILTTAE